MITQQYLKEILDYNSETGDFRWKVAKGRRVHIGDIAGNLHNVSGYRVIKIDRKIYKAHRLAWLYEYGEFPPNEIDHINRKRNDNRIINLRLATNTENLRNLSKYKNNTSGYTGVFWRKDNKKWQTQITVDNKHIHLGFFNSQEDAVAVRKAAEKKYFGEFAPR